MADKPKNDLPKVPPFVIPGASDQPANSPTSRNGQLVRASGSSTSRNNQQGSPPGAFRLIISFISVLSLGIALISGAWFAYGILGSGSNEEENSAEQTSEDKVAVPTATAEDPEGRQVTIITATPEGQNSVAEDQSENQGETAEEEPGKYDGVFSKVLVVGLTYSVGWIFSAIGVRSLRDKILPYAIQAYTWAVLGGIIVLQVLIMVRLYWQKYQFFNYMRYLLVFGAGLIALVGLHLILERHSLRPFGFIILLASLGHLYTIVYHYVFAEMFGETVIHERVWGDVVFFIVTTLVSILMMAHIGLLNGMRRLIHQIFTPKR
jgi:hypothetical protein